jgi:uncharacterized protein (TIGR02594 family)
MPNDREDPTPTRQVIPLQPFPSWWLIAQREKGVKEAPGTADNPRIVEYLKATDLPPSRWHDSTAHCAAFVCWCLEQARLPNPRYASARAFGHYGTRLRVPRLGALMIFWRDVKNPAPGQFALGHIGLYVRSSAEQYVVYGANQDNTVKDKPYPKERLLDIRWPPGVPL